MQSKNNKLTMVMLRETIVILLYWHLTLRLYFFLLLIVKSSLQCATEIINLIDWTMNFVKSTKSYYRGMYWRQAQFETAMPVVKVGLERWRKRHGERGAHTYPTGGARKGFRIRGEDPWSWKPFSHGRPKEAQNLSSSLYLSSCSETPKKVWLI